MKPVIPPECQEVQNENIRFKDEIQSLSSGVQLYINEIKRRNFESDMLNRMGIALQRCQNVEEFLNLIGQFSIRLFLEQPGEFFLLNENKQTLEKASTWGEIHQDPVLLRKEYCLSLSKNQICSFQDGETHLCKYHLTLTHNLSLHDAYVCVPVAFKERVIGIFHQHLPELSPQMKEHRWISMEHWDQLAVMVAEKLAFTYTNLKLQEKLRPQNLRDPLTQLFNQWYMEETLEREIHYAKRHNAPLWIYKMDVDRMKNFNDRHGYDVGDEVLKKLSAFVKRNIRAEDLACRSGGDEITLVLLGMQDDSAKTRADRLRQGIRELRVKTYDLLSVNTTVSCGLAAFPHHGESANELIMAADKALRQAKTSGRDIVVVN
jgi:diguanylate cyclase (GGDEF)-like protein